MSKESLPLLPWAVLREVLKEAFIPTESLNSNSKVLNNRLAVMFRPSEKESRTLP
jgi:hypothetical protein